MGSWGSRSGSNTADTTMDDYDESSLDHSRVLAYLLRSGQIRLSHPYSACLRDDAGKEDYIEYIADGKTAPDTSKLDASDLKQEFLHHSGLTHNASLPPMPSVPCMLQKRQIGACLRKGFSHHQRSQISSAYLPNCQTSIARLPARVFCGTYSKDGSVFLSACQDGNIRIYDVRGNRFNKTKTIRARDVGWSILDTAYSPDGHFVIYSSWSPSIHQCNVYGDLHETHTALHLEPQHGGHFCAFTIAFSNNGNEILAGANDGCIYVYDREKQKRTLKIEAHEDDLGSVCFADNTSQILFSAADDGLCKVWDRRTLGGTNSTPVGILAGHFDGITFIDPKGDGRHLITNSKDQSIKLWDIRCFSPSEVVESSRRAVAQQHWDYRRQHAPKICFKKRRIKGDTSLMTYRGHSVLRTLVRCRFSPQFTTGQRYICAACSTGNVIIYDVLTGEIISKLPSHTDVVRDVSWHPFENKIISSGWDGHHKLHSYRGVCEYDDRDYYDDSYDDSDNDSMLDHDLGILEAMGDLL